MKKTIAFIMAALAGLPAALAQDGAPATTSFFDDPFGDPMLPVYALLVLIGIVTLLVVAVAVMMIRALNALTEATARERAAKVGIAFQAKPSGWRRFVASLNASVPVEQERSIELDHNYDGIRELDNHLPPWWKYLFYGTIVWSVIYIVVYHFTDSLPLQEAEYQAQVAEAETQKQRFQAAQPKARIDETALVYSADAAILAKGKDLYAINCQACHKADGGGGIGPNLTDAYWLHGGDVKQVYATIKNGVPEKGMVAWAGVMSPEQLRDVSFYVMSLQGTNPPGAKAAQGELFIPAAAEAQKDSTSSRASL